MLTYVKIEKGARTHPLLPLPAHGTAAKDILFDHSSPLPPTSLTVADEASPVNVSVAIVAVAQLQYLLSGSELLRGKQCVDSQTDRGRDVNSENRRGLEVHHKFEARRLFYWQLARFCSPEDSVHVARNTMEAFFASGP
jgi:hypothetical protein